MQLQANHWSRLFSQTIDAAWRQACCCPGEAGGLYTPLFWEASLDAALPSVYCRFKLSIVLM